MVDETNIIADNSETGRKIIHRGGVQMADSVKDLMVNIFDYPHVPYWFTLEQAVQLMRMAFSGRERPEPVAILVFDEKYNLVGILGRNELLRGLGPAGIIQPNASGNAAGNLDAGVRWKNDFLSEAKSRTEKPVSEAMEPVRHFIGPEDELTAAAFMMLTNDLQMLPVLEGKKKLVGIIRMSEVFEALTNGVAGS
jgi:CBS domain-containing protein